MFPLLLYMHQTCQNFSVEVLAIFIVSLLPTTREASLKLSRGYKKTQTILLAYIMFLTNQMA